jgi:hypothetical protein
MEDMKGMLKNEIKRIGASCQLQDRGQHIANPSPFLNDFG